MLSITVELLHGVLRADSGGLASTSHLDKGEWPPSPHRLFGALVAADGTGDRCRVTTGEELLFLESAPPPSIEASGPDDVHHEPLVPRFVVSQTGGPAKGKAHQEYPARSGTQVRPGVRMAPRSPQVVYRWHVDVPPAVEEGLRARAARVGYLGTSDSPVAVTVSVGANDGTGEAVNRRARWEPATDGSAVVGVPRPGTLDALDAHHAIWLEHGPSVQRAQSPGLRRHARYRPPGQSEDVTPVPTCVWLRFDSAVSGRRVVAVAETLKKAILVHHQRRFGEPPAVLHGHVDHPSQPHDVAWFVPLPDVGHAHARGRIHGAVVILPVSTEASTTEAVRSIVHDDLEELVGSGFSVGVRPWSGERRPSAATPERWNGPARRVATAFPALHERRGVTLTLTEIARWCRHSDLPEPVAARSGRHPLLPGGVDLVPSEVNRKGKAPRPYSHLEVEFATSVAGPVVLGAGKTRGLGLCAPIGEL